MKLAACIEWLFQAEYQDLPARIHAAHAAGIPAVEFHLWRDKPLDAIERALHATGVRLASFCVDPRASLVDPAEHAKLLDAVRDAIPVAQRFKGASMIIASGFTRPDVSSAKQQEIAIGVLRKAAALAVTGNTLLLLEPVNMAVNGARMFVDEIARGLAIVAAVDSPGLRLLCDVYHSAMSGEQLASAIGDRMRWIGHVQVADTHGRHEPGTGTLDWPRIMKLLRDLGYDGDIGLEYLPTLPTLESLAQTRRTLGV
jgi:hydroxypyruvate isomerase